jgi:hypothetical protein
MPPKPPSIGGNGGGFSAVSDLGLGGTLGQQVAGETEEQRKKRMAMIQQQQMLGPSGSMAVTSLLGNTGGKSAGY